MTTSSRMPAVWWPCPKAPPSPRDRRGGRRTCAGAGRICRSWVSAGTWTAAFARVDRGDVDAVVVACAGLRRLGLTPPGFALEIDQMLPAVGQGALAVEMRGDDRQRADVATIDDPDSRAAVTAERSLLRGLRAGCAAPVGALATVTGNAMELRAAVVSADGSQMYECVMSGSVDHAYDIGVQAADELIGQGAGRLLGENR